MVKYYKLIMGAGGDQLDVQSRSVSRNDGRHPDLGAFPF